MPGSPDPSAVERAEAALRAEYNWHPGTAANVVRIALEAAGAAVLAEGEGLRAENERLRLWLASALAYLRGEATAGRGEFIHDAQAALSRATDKEGAFSTLSSSGVPNRRRRFTDEEER